MAHIKDPKAKRAKRKKPTGNATVDFKDAKQGAKSLIGHEARLAGYVSRTLQLKKLNYTHIEVGEIIAEEYKLTSIPPITTVADWYKKGMGAVREDIEELQWQMRLEAFSQLEKMKSKWMPLAMAEHLEITRWKMVEGSSQPELDERAVEEQLKATREVVNIMSRQAKLLGLDLAQATSKDGDGPGSLQDLQIWLISQVNLTQPNGGGSIDVHSEVLELKAGIPEADSV